MSSITITSARRIFLAEQVNDLGDWGDEFATLEWVDWFNHRRLHGEIGMIPPAELEEAHYRQTVAATEAATH